MASSPMLTLPDLYRQVNRTIDGGVVGYYVPKKYEDPVLQMKNRELAKIPKGQKSRKYETKRGSYLDDQFRLRKQVPGPGIYKLDEDLWPQKSKNLHHQSKKLTYIDQILQIEKRQKKPAPGQYDVVKTIKQQQLDKKKMAEKRIVPIDRITYLDQIQYQANLLPGVGMYNPRQRIKTQPPRTYDSPQQWRKKHQNEQKNYKKPVEQPDMGTYNPQSVDLRLFSDRTDKLKSSNLVNKLERFKTLGSGVNLGPGKYVLLQQWKGKQKETAKRNGLDSISKGPNKSVYYN